MKDKISIQRVALLHPKFIPQITKFIEDKENEFGITLRVSQGIRTMDEQAALYAQGRTTKGNIVTYSPTGSSYHNYGLAADLVIVKSDSTIDWNYDYSKLSENCLPLTWGGTFPHKDEDHFENRFGLNWREMLHRYTIKDFIPNTEFINI